MGADRGQAIAFNRALTFDYSCTLLSTQSATYPGSPTYTPQTSFTPPPTWSKLSEVLLLSMPPPFATLNALGTLVKCDASIKAMLVDIDSKNGNEYIIEELDEEHILVKETKINELKSRLNQMMRERLKEPESSDSE
ncbi:uncharacterized protein yc1106_08904 [Curvularia clavata]|uniref:General transcription and DNA repair factor IIH subunit TFB5 n=1 Tax=Curvularia clavata TaxID=95742 RepID=A0A9Q8ZG77_CURCL|nr:uncharacterized protein yc1106_08904 [Curvularia clavata]